MKTLTVLGSTGSIGVNTLAVAARHPARYQVLALTANTNVDRLFQQCLAHRPEYAVMADQEAALELQRRLRQKARRITVLAGPEEVARVAALAEVDYVMAAIVGAAGLLPTLAAARAGKRVLLANKEALVMAGRLFMDTARDNRAELLPIDSEHNAIFQCLPAGFDPADPGPGPATFGVKKILLTASGGPFRALAPEQLARVTPEQACRHPNWVMGRKISVDSATMMNKGLEIMEACWLFHARPEDIEVVLHPESVIHSMVQYTDGSVLAQLGNPDMRTPIAHGLAWPERIEAGVKPLDLFEIARLRFERPDPARFPCLDLARGAIRAGGTAGAILNAANEVAVHEFLQKRLRFTDIAGVIETVLRAIPATAADSLAAILEADRQARAAARGAVRARAA